MFSLLNFRDFIMAMVCERPIRGDVTANFDEWASVWAHREMRKLGQVKVVRHVSNRDSGAIMYNYFTKNACGVVGVAAINHRLTIAQADRLVREIRCRRDNKNPDPVKSAWRKLFPKITRVPACIMELSDNPEAPLDEGPITLYMVFTTLAGASFLVDFTRKAGRNPAYILNIFKDPSLCKILHDHENFLAGTFRMFGDTFLDQAKSIYQQQYGNPTTGAMGLAEMSRHIMGIDISDEIADVLGALKLWKDQWFREGHLQFRRKCRYP